MHKHCTRYWAFLAFAGAREYESIGLASVGRIIDRHESLMPDILPAGEASLPLVAFDRPSKTAELGI